MTSTWSAVPRLCAVASREAATLVRPSQDLEAICGLGFNALLLPGEVFRGCSDTATGEGANGLDWAALATLVTAAGASGLAIVLDVDLSVFPVDHPLVRAHPNAFSVRPGRGEDAPLDPRKSAPDDGLARIRGGATAGVAALAAWAGAGLDRARAAGVQGVRLSRPSALSTQTWGDILAQAPDLTVIAASLDGRDSAAAFAGCGVDYLTTSLAWWDERAAWLVEEYGALRAAAPLMADISAVEGAAAVRAVGLAPMVARGLIASLGQIGGAGVPVEALRTANRQLEALADYDGELRSLTGPGARVAALIRAAGPDLRSASAALVALVNPDEASQASVDADEVLGASPLPLANLERLQGSGDPLAPLAPGEVRLLTATRAKPIIIPTRPVQPGADAAAEAARIAIEAVSPSVDGGRFPVKRTVGDRVVVEADVFADGHEQLAAALLWRAADGEDWRATPMTALGNDRWRAEFAPDRMGRHLFAVEAWLDVFGGFRRDLTKKRHAGVATPLDVAEGVRLVEQARDRSEGALRSALADMLAQVEAAAPDARVAHMLSPDLAALMQQADPRPYRVRSEAQPLDAERLGARFSSWYELFPRSQGPVPQAGEPPRHGTFDDVIARLPAVRAMGFDVLYMPPIHPIGHQNRKGRNNSLTAGPDDPGSPYAIGADAGGHDAVHPELGGIEGFDRLVAAARAQGLEIALDFAVQCAPDHPWLKAHPGWFDYRPDGSIKYAENPPKTYEDIVNVDFYQPDAVPDLWLALRDAVLFWVEHGVRLFRVDNPHTKPLPFWEWMIADVRGRYPDTVFLAEAFTRPKLMYRLAKIGFSQSYTYFTWRHTKAELTEYLTELTTTAPKDFFRPHFFVNTPDINPYFLQTSGRAGFLIRAALAATLSGLFGVYSGFELLEAEPVLGKEDYKDSEKYEIKPRDWTRPGDIIAEITRLNAIRKANPALQTHLGVRFYTAFNDQVLYFGKAASDADGGVRSEMVLVAVSLDPHASQGFDFEIPLWEWGLPDDGELAVEDLLSQTRFAWRGKRQNWVLTPDRPYAIWCVQPVTGS